MSDRSDRATPSDLVLVDVADRVATMTLNRPDQRNALNRALQRRITEVVARSRADDDVDVIILTGADPGVLRRRRPQGARSGAGPATAATWCCPATPAGPLPPHTKPIIGAVNGVAVTGGLRAGAGLRLPRGQRAGPLRRHPLPGRASCPGGGLTVLLPEAVGVRRAREMSTTGNYIDAELAAAWGLVNHVVAPRRAAAVLPRARRRHRLQRPGRGPPDARHLPPDRRPPRPPRAGRSRPTSPGRGPASGSTRPRSRPAASPSSSAAAPSRPDRRTDVPAPCPSPGSICRNDLRRNDLRRSRPGQAEGVAEAPHLEVEVGLVVGDHVVQVAEQLEADRADQLGPHERGPGDATSSRASAAAERPRPSRSGRTARGSGTPGRPRSPRRRPPSRTSRRKHGLTRLAGSMVSCGCAVAGDGAAVDQRVLLRVGHRPGPHGPGQGQPPAEEVAPAARRLGRRRARRPPRRRRRR